MPKIEEAKDKKPPPPSRVTAPSQAQPAAQTTPTPRIQDLAKTAQLSQEADKENKVSNSSRELAKKVENVPKESETKKEEVPSREPTKDEKNDIKIEDSEVMHHVCQPGCEGCSWEMLPLPPLLLTRFHNCVPPQISPNLSPHPTVPHSFIFISFVRFVPPLFITIPSDNCIDLIAMITIRQFDSI